MVVNLRWVCWYLGRFSARFLFYDDKDRLCFVSPGIFGCTGNVWVQRVCILVFWIALGSLMIVGRGRAKEWRNISRNSSAIRCCFRAVSPNLGGSFVTSSKSDGSLLRKGIVLPRIGWERKRLGHAKRDRSQKLWIVVFFRFGSGDDFLCTFHLFGTPEITRKLIPTCSNISRWG